MAEVTLLHRHQCQQAAEPEPRRARASDGVNDPSGLNKVVLGKGHLRPRGEEPDVVHGAWGIECVLPTTYSQEDNCLVAPSIQQQGVDQEIGHLSLP